MYKKIKKAIKDGHNIFITGGGGVGKSYTLNQLVEEFPEIIVTATTGAAAVNINGQTIHSWAGMGICDKPVNYIIKTMRNSKNLSKKLESIQDAKILAIDEISMLDLRKFEYLDELLCALRKNPFKPFGGIQMILIGDFFQLPPVGIEKGEKFCFESKIWNKLNLKIFNLEKVYRQDDKKLIETLNNIRKGKPDIDLFQTRQNMTPPEGIIRLYGTKEPAARFNKLCFDKLKGKQIEYWSSDRIYVNKKGIIKELKPSESGIPETDRKIFDNFNKECRMPHLITLKVGAKVMLLSNIDVEEGLCNGALGIIKKLEPHEVTVKFDNGITKTIRRVEIEYRKNGQVKVTRKQMPLTLAYSFTIHKVQGATFKEAFIDFIDIFTAGQCYVALSRVKSLDGLYMKNFNKSKIMVDPKVIEFYENLK